MSAVLRLLLVTLPALAGVIAVAVLIWWIGPMVKIGALAPLESELARGILIGLLLLVFALRWAWRRWRLATLTPRGVVMSAGALSFIVALGLAPRARPTC